MLIALEGIDGSGKGTQAQRLYDRLRTAGHTASLISFPRYEATLFGRAIGEFLNGRFGSLEQVSPFLAALLYAGDRFESKDVLRSAIDQNEFVILDRYVASNVAHQGAKLDAEERRKLAAWIHEIEYGVYRLPRPDLTILLDLPASQAQMLIATKQARSYTKRKADLQEADGRYLELVREVYLELAREEPDWAVVSCVADGRLRSIEEIGEELWRTVASTSPTR